VKWLRKKLLILAITLLLVITIPVMVAALKQSQIIHVKKTYIQPLPTPTSTSPSTSIPAEVKFSLFFPNGTAYVLNQDHISSIYGASNLDVNGIPVNVQSNLGSPPTGYVAGAVVVRNDGKVPINVNATLTKLKTPSDIELIFICYSINPSTWGNQLNGWMGYGNLATGNTVEVGQFVWLSLCVIMTSNVPGNFGVVRNHPTFSYSFDVVVTATQV